MLRESKHRFNQTDSFMCVHTSRVHLLPVISLVQCCHRSQLVPQEQLKE